MTNLETPVTYLKGVGPHRAELLRRLGILTAGDLLYHIPHRYEDASTVAPIDAAVNASLRDVCKDVLDTLTPREAKVLRMRFGIEMNTDHTLEEVGKQFDVTRERIRQIEAKALRKLRHPSRSEKLRSFIDGEG